MIKKIKKPLFINLLILVLFFSSGRLLAQSCDSNIQKALEQTRITTFEKITQGTVGEFVVRYPLAGTTYTLTDQAGATYTRTYTGTPVAITLRIPIGAVNTTRRFSLKAQNGVCSYETGFDYTITPQTTLALSTRVEQEWCSQGGGIFFKLIGTGANEANYNFYYKKSTDTNYDRSESKRISPTNGVQAIVAGKYDILAELKTDPTQKIEVKDIEVKSALEATEYTVHYAPATCPGRNGDIRVNVTKGKYPLYFTLLKANGSEYSTTTTRQTSNIFTNIPAGDYKAKVEDYCAINGGNAQQPKPVTAKNYNFTIKGIHGYMSAREYGCRFVNFELPSFEVENLKELLDTDAFPYPFTFRVNLESPTNHRIYTKDYVINNRSELNSIFRVSEENGQPKYFKLINNIRENYEVEYGFWKIKPQLISCGTTKNISEVQVEVLEPFAIVTATTANLSNNSCNGIAIIRGATSSSITYSDDLALYFVLKTYPPGFDPEAAGFYRVRSTNPALNNKYAKLTEVNRDVVIQPEFLTAGQQFTFDIVNEDCNKVKTQTVTVPAATPQGSSPYIRTIGSCKGVSSNGTDYASLYISNGLFGRPLVQVVIKSTTADLSKLPEGMALPYIIPDSQRPNSSNWVVRDLPKGQYDIEYTSDCGVKSSLRYNVEPDIYNFSWEEGCLPKLHFTYKGVQERDYTEYFIEYYNEVTRQWEQVGDKFSPRSNVLGQYSVNNNKGKFRLSRLVSASSVMGNGIMTDCKQVISEKEFKGTMLEPIVYGIECTNNKYHVAVNPRGGVAPYTYRLASQTVGGITTPINRVGDDANFFLNIDGSDREARYVFEVKDACGETKTVDYKVTNFIAPKLETEQEYYCENQKAKLSIPQIGDTKVKIEWYRSDNPSHILGTGHELVINSLTNDDFTYTYGVRLKGLFDPSVNVCIDGANLGAYKFKKVTLPTASFVFKSAGPVTMCAPTGNAQYDLFQLFTLPNELQEYLRQNPLAKLRILDKNGVIAVPENAKVNLRTVEFLNKTNTFVLRLDNPCGNTILPGVEESITVKLNLPLYLDSNEVKLCKDNPTYDDLKDYILANNRNPREYVVGFKWYTSLTDAEQDVREKAGTESIGALTVGTPKTLYLRFTKPNFCDSEVKTIKVNKVSTAALPVKDLGTTCVTTVRHLKRLIDPTDFANVRVYHNNILLSEDYELTSDANITYTKQVASVCETAKARVIFTAKPVTEITAQVLSLCTTLDNYGTQQISRAEIEAEIKRLYPNAQENGVKLYDKYLGHYREETKDNFRLLDALYYTVTETGKCESTPKLLRLAVSTNITTALPVSISLCENTTVADLLTNITGNNKKVYKNGVLQTATDPIDWDMADRYTYTLEDTGKCPSYRKVITLTKSTNVTPAPTKVVSFCSATPKVVDLRTAIGDSTAKIYLKNGNRYDQQPDTAFINTALTYYYTIEQAGKCISPKGLIAYSIGTASPAGYFNNSVTCPTTVGQLKAEIRAAEPTRVSDELKIYEGTVDPPTSASLTDNTPIAATQYSYTYTPTGGCPSPIRIVDITKPNAPTVAQTTQTVCGTTATVADLQPQGANIRWYQSATGGIPLATNTILTIGDYYVAQANATGTCESPRVKVTVQQGTGGNETLNFQSTNNSLNCISTGQLRFQIQNAQTGKSYKVQLTEYPTGYTGATEFTIIEGDKDGATPFVKFTQYNMPAGNYKAKLITCNVANGQPVPATIARMQRDFPAPDRRNNDFGSDQAYRDIQSGGQPSCDYLDIRYSNNTNSPFYKYFYSDERTGTRSELLNLYEYTAYSDKDLQEHYGGNPNDTRIVWRDLFSVPAGKSSVVEKMIYYDLAAHNRTYKDLKEDRDKLPKFYFRIKGQTCTSAPMLVGDIRFMNTGIVFGGSCQAPEMSVTAENQIVCYPVTYVIKHNGVKVGEGRINSAGERKKITTLDNGQPFKADQEYEVTFTSQDGQTEVRKEKFNTFYDRVRPGGEYKQETRCFGSTQTPKGRIDILFRVNQSGSILSMNGFKVTLLEAPAGYVEEPGKLKLNETVTIAYQNTSKVVTNIMATHNQDDLTQNFTLPEGTYKIKVEDPCGKVTYVYSGTDSNKEEFKLVYPSYQEKPLTPETKTECTRVKVYPFKGNPAFDWLKAQNKNRSVYVYLYKRPTGINATDVTVSRNLSQQVRGTTYIKAVYNPNVPTSVDQYFSLPRNQNSEGSYTFIYGGKIDATDSNEQDIISYITSGGTNGCVRTFDISVDDVLLNFDRNGYIGYKCENNTGKIVVKAINGIGGSGTYKYELYDVKNGTLIATQTAAKGVEVTFTNLGTFAPGQNSRWVRITDSACASEPVWRQLPIADASQANLLLKNPLNTAYCEGAALTIELRPVGATKYVWTLPNGTTQETTLPKLEINSLQAAHSGTYSVKAEGLTCGANVLTFNYNITVLSRPTAGQTYTFCQGANVATLKARVDTNTTIVKVYKNGVLVSDDNQQLTTTDTYTVSKSSASCETDKVGVTIALTNPSAPTVAPARTECPTSVSTLFDMATLVTPALGYTLKWYDADTGGTALAASPKVDRYVTAKTITTKYVSQEKDGCLSARVPVTYIVDDTQLPTLTINDIVLDCSATNFDTLVTNWLATAVATDTCGTPVITNNYVKPADLCGIGEITVIFTAKDGFNNQTQKTAKIRFVVAKDDDYTATPVKTSSSDQVVKNNGGTPYNILTNDKLYGNGATISNVTIAEVTPNTYVKIDTATGQVKVKANTPVGTYTVTYRICDRNTPTACSNTATVKVKVTPSINAVDDGDKSVPATGGEVEVLSNDRLNGNPIVPTDVEITIPDNGGLTGLDPDPSTGKLKVPGNATPGTYTVRYKICDKTNPGVCDTAVVKITVTGTPPPTIVANDDPDTSVAKGGEVDILTNDRLNGNPIVPTDVEITIPDNGGLTGLDPDPSTGKLKVPANATPGTYTVTYKICDKTNPGVCDTAVVKITVTAGNTITAVDDDFGEVTNAVTNTTVGTVFTLGVDTLTGKTGVLSPITDVILTPGVSPHPGITMGAEGNITVQAGTPAATYTYEYTICERGNDTNCDTGIATIKVVDRSIFAHDDGPWRIGTKGGLTLSILTNDIVGARGASSDNVTIERTVGKPAPHRLFEMNSDGRITVKEGIDPGTYEYYYTIVDKSNSSNTASAKATIIISDFVAADDVFDFGNPNNQTLTTESVLKNDQVGDKKNPSPDTDVNLTPGVPSHPGLTMNPDGTITIAPGTPNGDYTYTYTICKKNAPTECEMATAYIRLHDTLEANDDDFSATPVPSAQKTVVGNVLTNNVGGTDKLSGEPITDASLVKLTVLTDGGLTGVELSENGDISVPAGTPSGRYLVRYRICQVADITNCKEAVVTIVVSNEIPLVFHNGISVNGDGKNDGFVIEGIEYYPDNVLRIFNRWGVLVYEKERYGNSDPFVGISNGRATVSKDTKLPQGTYYYLLEYTDLKGNRQEKSGWLYLKVD